MVKLTQEKLICFCRLTPPSSPTTASAVSAVQSDRIQAAGNPQLQERQRGGEQQDEAGQAGAV